jgi:hypothetical protein
MWHAWERRSKFPGFGSESQKQRDHLEDHDIDVIRMDLRKIGWGSVGWIQLA